MADVIDLIARVQQRVPKAPMLVVRDAYVAAVRDWCGQTRWARDTLEATLVADTADYSLGSDPFLEIIDVPVGKLMVTLSTGRITEIPMKPSDPHSFDGNTPFTQPRTYAYIPESDITFYPTPDKTYGVVLELAVQPTRSTTQIPDKVVAKHWRAFEAGALAHLLMLPEPWKDPVIAKVEESIFKASVNNAKADVARGFQSGTVLIRRLPWIVG